MIIALLIYCGSFLLCYALTSLVRWANKKRFNEVILDDKGNLLASSIPIFNTIFAIIMFFGIIIRILKWLLGIRKNPFKPLQETPPSETEDPNKIQEKQKEHHLYAITNNFMNVQSTSGEVIADHQKYLEQHKKIMFFLRDHPEVLSDDIRNHLASPTEWVAYVLKNGYDIIMDGEEIIKIEKQK